MVCNPRMISTNFIIGTGLKKCIPITLSGRPLEAASVVKDNDEVLDARTTSSRHIILSSARIGILISRLSVTASMIKSLSEKS